jgi:hypothetical protein
MRIDCNAVLLSLPKRSEHRRSLYRVRGKACVFDARIVFVPNRVNWDALRNEEAMREVDVINTYTETHTYAKMEPIIPDKSACWLETQGT